MMVDVMTREGLSLDEARRRFWVTDRSGLITDDPASNPRDFQVPYARLAVEVAGWSSQGDGITLADIVRNAEPTMLIGTSTQPAAFTEQIVRQMASKVERPIIMPLSNPTSKCEALPKDLIRWTEGRAWSRPAVRSRPSYTKVALNRSRKPTTRSSSAASGLG
jgi:malate dehydrogenase (oxaloacetate-decarboxylating)